MPLGAAFPRLYRIFYCISLYVVLPILCLMLARFELTLRLIALS